VKKWFLILIPCFQLLQAQTGTCVLKEPVVHINFGVGEGSETNISTSYTYGRVSNSCPTDGHYAFTGYTSDCFRGDWITMTEDHTPGDAGGNMMLFNASYTAGEFFSTTASGLKPGANFEFAIWMLNVCRPSDKCPYPLLPDISISITTPEGKLITELNTGLIKRYNEPQWAKYNVMFKVPAGVTTVGIKMVNHNPGGCGNDFAMDDITFRECVITPPPITKKKTTPPPNNTAVAKPPVKKEVTTPPVKKETTVATPPPKKPAPKPVAKATTPTRSPAARASIPDAETNKPSDTIKRTVVKAPALPPPAVLVSRTNALVKKIEAGPGDIKIELYDNGQIDGDTVSIYHNNKLILSRVRISEKAITFKITIDENNPHHEIVMVANNLGTIPPNTSLMYVTAGSKRYEVFISSSETSNAKVVFDLMH